MGRGAWAPEGAQEPGPTPWQCSRPEVGIPERLCPRVRFLHLPLQGASSLDALQQAAAPAPCAVA